VRQRLEYDDLSEPLLSQHLTDRELQQRRIGIRRGLARVNFVIGCIIAILTGLALSAFLLFYRAQQSAQDAQQSSFKEEQSRRRAEVELWKSHLAQARAERLTGRVGRRFESLKAITAASAMNPTVELRNEAIAAMALLDIEKSMSVPIATENQIITAKFAPRLERYATVDRTGEIRLFGVADQKEIFHFSAPGKYDLLIFSPDGSRMLTRGSEVSHLWDLNAGRLITNLPAAPVGGALARPADFSPDSRHLYLGWRDGSISEVDCETGVLSPLLATGIPAMHILRAHPTENKIILSHDRVLQIWDNTNGKLVKEFPLLPQNGSSLDISADGRLAAVGCDDHNIYVFNLATGDRRVLVGHNRERVRVVFHPAGDLRVSFAWDGTTRFWDPLSGLQLLIATLSWPQQFSLDGKRLIFSGSEKALDIWNVAGHDEYRRLSYPPGAGTGYYKQMSFSPNGRFMAAGDERGLHVWDTDSGRHTWSDKIGRTRTSAFNPEGTTLFVSTVDALFQYQLQSGEGSAVVGWNARGQI
jgi:WD40 repeat protein